MQFSSSVSALGCTYSVLVLEKLQVGHFVASKAIDDLVLRQEVRNLLRLLLVLVQLRQHILSLLGVLGGRLRNAVEILVQRGHVVGHVGVLQQLDLARQNLLGQLGIALLLGLVALELDEREEQVTAQMRRNVGHD